MKYKVGDKVKFLNDVGGGVICTILDPTTVKVMREDGFEIPVSTSQIIPAQREDLKESVFNQDFSFPDDLKIASTQEQTRNTKLAKFTSLNNKPAGIYVTYIPQDQVWLMKDPVDLYLINSTSFELVYSFLVKESDESYSNIDFGSMLPFSKIHIETIERDDLENWLNGAVQVLFFKENDKSIQMPLSEIFKVKPLRFLKEESFQSCNFLEERAMLIYMGSPMTIEAAKAATEKDVALSCFPKNPVQEPYINRYKINAEKAEVDLHIETLVENHSHLTNGEIVEIQLKEAIACIESAIATRVGKVILIHGVGQGVLKKELVKVLNQYHNIEFYDADMAKYGQGATEVKIFVSK